MNAQTFKELQAAQGVSGLFDIGDLHDTVSSDEELEGYAAVLADNSRFFARHPGSERTLAGWQSRLTQKGFPPTDYEIASYLAGFRDAEEVIAKRILNQIEARQANP